MSNEKPFAEVASQVGGWQSIRIGDEEVELTDMADHEEARRIAAVINAAIETREAKLRAALAALAEATAHLAVIEQDSDAGDEARADAERLVAAARELLGLPPSEP